MIYKSHSKIHGYGLFCRDTILINTIIGVAFYKINNKGENFDEDYCYSYIGRWINHSNKNNVTYIMIDNNIYYKSICNILKDEEILMNYELLPIFENGLNII